MQMSKTCPQCGDDFKSLGGHLSRGTCEYPQLTNKQLDMLTGILMGDGNIDTSDVGNPYMKIDSITKDYLEHIDVELGVFSNGVNLDRTSEENAKRHRNSGFNIDADGDSYSDVYRLRTMRAPNFRRFRSWYGPDGKNFPENINLTPTVLKNWYCCDGTLREYESRGRISIVVNNEYSNFGKLCSYFTQVNLPKPRDYSDKTLSFTADETDELLNYMGKPLPGFEYKWRNV